MSRERWIAAGLIALALGALMAWANYRERQMQACLAKGQAWNGPASRCETPRVGPILKRALERS